MKKLTALLLAAILLLPVCGCEDEAEIWDTVSGTTTQVSEETTTDNSITTASSSTKTTATPPGKTTTTSTTGKTTAICPTAPTKNPQRLPTVKHTKLGIDSRYTDIVKTSGGFAVAGTWLTEESCYAILEVYDQNAVLQKQYKDWGGNGFTKLVACSDGGYLASSYSPPIVTKLNADLELQWEANYENPAGEGIVRDIEEIQPGVYAVLFSSYLTEGLKRTFKITFVNNDGTVIETIELMRCIDPTDADLIPDGKGGFYLTASAEYAHGDALPLLKQACDPQKGCDAVVLRFSSDRKPVWATAVGGHGTDWCEEGAMDDDGNFYLAMATSDLGNDPFWPIQATPSTPFRRMLVKLSPDGKILYKAPLSGWSRAVDQVFGIGFHDNRVFVVGQSYYHDTIQNKYPCEQITESLNDDLVSCIYTVCLQENGSVFDRKIFRGDLVSDTVTGAAVLSDGSVVLCGSVSPDCNPFNLPLDGTSSYDTALFVYEPFLK